MSGLLSLPVMRSLAIAGQTVFVNRSDPESRKGCQNVLLQRCSSEKWKPVPMIVFPEGVVTNGVALVQFKVGAFAPGQPVVPVCLRYRWRHYNPSGCGKNHIMPLALLRTLLQFANFCQVDIMDAYHPSPAECADARLFASNVRRQMAAHSSLPATEHSYADAALSFGSQAHTGSDVELSRLAAMYCVEARVIENLFHHFDRHDQSQRGCLSANEFLESMSCLEGRSAASVERLVAFADQDRSGAVEFREFVAVAALLAGSPCCSLTSRAKLAFLLLDTDGEDSVPGDVFGERGARATGERIKFQVFQAAAEANPESLQDILAPAALAFGVQSIFESKKTQ